MAKSSRKSRLKTAKIKAEEYKGEFDEKKEALEKFIKEHPLVSIAIAAWIGHILTKIFDRR